MHCLRRSLVGLALALSVTLPACAKELPTGAKFFKILSLLERESVREVPRAALIESALRELEQAGQTLPKGSPEERLRRFCEQNPDGSALKTMIRGASRALDDPYLTYLDPQSFRGVTRRFQGQAECTPGFSVVKDHDQPVKILEVSPGGPAQLAPGDFILSLAGQDTLTMTAEEARALLAGPEGSRLQLQVQRADGTTASLDLPRLPADERTVIAEVKQQTGHKQGYLRIRNFASSTPVEMRRALAELRQAGVEGLVIDLRNNGGGLVNSAVEVCAQLLPGGTEVVTVQRRNRKEVRKVEQSGAKTPEMVVLVNQESASAAEIMAAALHDAKAATLVGSRSFGKGTVQRYVSLGDGSGLKFTTARYLTPRGTSIHGSGIVPDIVENDARSVERGLELLSQ